MHFVVHVQHRRLRRGLALAPKVITDLTCIAHTKKAWHDLTVTIKQ